MGLNVYRAERKAMMGDRIDFLLPMPPSTNELFFNSSKGRTCTVKYTRWKRLAGQMLMLQKVGRIGGPVHVSLEIEDKHPNRDADNCLKPVLDILADKNINVIDGDNAKTVRSVSATWTRNKPVEGVRVTIKRADQ